MIAVREVVGRRGSPGGEGELCGVPRPAGMEEWQACVRPGRPRHAASSQFFGIPEHRPGQVAAWCWRGRDSNPTPLRRRDFESAAFTDSATGRRRRIIAQSAVGPQREAGAGKVRGGLLADELRDQVRVGFPTGRLLFPGGDDRPAGGIDDRLSGRQRALS